MPKNQSQNAFYFFMLDWKQQEERKGCTFINGLKGLQSDPRMNEAWQNLSTNEKLFYKEKEKMAKLKQKSHKKTNLGESLEEVLQIQIREKALSHKMKQHIASIIEEAKASNRVHNSKFYAIHVNVYCVYEGEIQHKYCPAEIGLVEFSLDKGITRSYSKIVDSEIRKGYAYEAQVHSSNTHQIPTQQHFGEKNYGQIFNEICAFIGAEKLNGKMPPLFTLFADERVRNSVISVLDFLASFSDEDDKSLIVYPFEELFVNLYNINLTDDWYGTKIDEALAHIYLNRDPFDYKTSLCCDFHEAGPGANFCSKSIVQRWIFTLFSHVCCLLEIKLIPGHHEPIENSLSNEDRELNKSFAALDVCEGACAVQAPSTASSAINYVKPTSERTYRDEEIRRAQSKPLTITFHGSFNNESTNRTISSEVQPDFSTPRRPQVAESGTINMNQNNFPSIGRGAAINRYMNKYKASKNGYASCFK